jgi:hypothetical protein
MNRHGITRHSSTRHHKANQAVAAAYGLLLATIAGQVHAQDRDEDFRATVMTMRSCAAIVDVPERVACYDRAVGRGDGAQSAARAAGASPAPAAIVQAAPLSGFGAETLPQERAARQAELAGNVQLAVVAVRQNQPGIATLTMADGSRWRFVDPASFGFDMPRVGETVRLERGSLGGFYLHFNGQRALRIQRVQ